jgi:hypothetical protein
MDGSKEFNISPIYNIEEQKDVYDHFKIGSPLEGSNIMLLFSEDELLVKSTFSKANSNISAFSKVNFETTKTNSN